MCACLCVDVPIDIALENVMAKGEINMCVYVFMCREREIALGNAMANGEINTYICVRVCIYV